MNVTKSKTGLAAAACGFVLAGAVLGAGTASAADQPSTQPAPSSAPAQPQASASPGTPSGPAQAPGAATPGPSAPSGAPQAPGSQGATPPAPPTGGQGRPAPAAPKPHIDGTVESVTSSTLKVRDREGFLRVVQIGSGTKIMDGGPNSTTTSIEKGDHVHAEGTVADDDTSLNATQVTLGDPGPARGPAGGPARGPAGGPAGGSQPGGQSATPPSSSAPAPSLPATGS